MRPKFLDAAARDAAERDALERAIHAAREEEDANSLWLSEQGKSFALGAASMLLLLILVGLIYFGVRR